MLRLQASFRLQPNARMHKGMGSSVRSFRRGSCNAPQEAQLYFRALLPRGGMFKRASVISVWPMLPRWSSTVKLRSDVLFEPETTQS
jgi:hypothetical protein